MHISYGKTGFRGPGPAVHLAPRPIDLRNRFYRSSSGRRSRIDAFNIIAESTPHVESAAGDARSTEARYRPRAGTRR